MATIAYRISIHAAHCTPGPGVQFDHTMPFASDQPVIPADGQTAPAAWVTEYIRQVVDSVTVTGPDAADWTVRVWLDYLPLPIVVPTQRTTSSTPIAKALTMVGTDHNGMPQAGSPFNANDSIARRTGRYNEVRTMWTFDITTRQLTFVPDDITTSSED